MSSRALVAALVLVAACGGPTEPPVTPAPAPPPVAAADAAAPAAPIQVRLLAFNDFHGNLKPPTHKVPKVDGPVGGAAYFAAHLKRLATGHPNTVVVAAGDLVGASPLTSALFHDEPTIAVMNAIGLGVTAIGNHELDEGMDELLRLKRGGCHPKDGCKFEKEFPGSKFDWLAANVTRGAESPLPAYVIKEVGGVPIAFVGMPLEDTPRSVVPEGVAGLTFADEAKTANALVPEIKAKGANTIILLIHEGGDSRPPGLDECNDFKGAIVGITEKLDPAYKAVVSGHTHQLYNCKVGNRPVTSASSFGRVITTIDLDIDPKTKEPTRVVAHNHAVTHDVAPDPAVQAIVDKAAAAAAPMENRVIGRIGGTLAGGSRNGQESTLGRVIADAQLAATKKIGAKVAFVNAAGIRSDIVYAKSGEEKEDGLVTYGEAFAAQPFGNRLITMTVTGADLTACLGRELRGAGVYVSDGLVIKWDRESKDPPLLLLDGKPIKPTATLKITTNNFVADRDPALAKIEDRTPGVLDLEALEAYFATHKVVDPPKKSRLLKP
ncbi:MAG: bifunctional metallophosphatase/5'-nucleotidase [Labilithrix sp.]|nr:bifunctional metallophosphatase/5'-nucleotidase [Labilithrix sp.]MCW5817187.1 bifunctional metallophosphatase/5'-nucleotidase [Labilithrix sp.]